MDSGAALGQQHGDMTAEKANQQAEKQQHKQQQQEQQEQQEGQPQQPVTKGGSGAQPNVSAIGKNAGEVAFFKLLHQELKKAVRFFDRATEEFAIREERVIEGMEIMKQPNSIMVNEKWTLMGKSIYRLYKDLCHASSKFSKNYSKP